MDMSCFTRVRPGYCVMCVRAVDSLLNWHQFHTGVAPMRNANWLVGSWWTERNGQCRRNWPCFALSISYGRPSTDDVLRFNSVWCLLGRQVATPGWLGWDAHVRPTNRHSDTMGGRRLVCNTR